MHIYCLNEMATKGSNSSKYQSTTCSLLDLSSLAISTSVIVLTSYKRLNKVNLMESYLGERAGCFYKQTASFWNVLDTLSDVIICNHLSAARRLHYVP
jgi:hypothetical protein